MAKSKINKMHRHAAKILMPMLEWICIAAIPICLCKWILDSCSWPILLHEIQSSIDKTESAYSQLKCSYSKWIHFNILFATSIISLITILLLGDDELGLGTGAKQIYNGRPNSRIDCNDGTAVSKTSSKRGTGIAMGAHAMPLLYTSINIFIYKSKCAGGSESTCLGNEDAIMAIHMRLASYGGFSFAASNLYTKWQHKNLSSRHFKTDGRKIPWTSMQLTSTIYIMLLITELIVSRLCQQSRRQLISMILIASIQIFLILNHPSPSKCSWQNAFTPGEWMAVSTFTASLLAEFFLQHILRVNTVDLPEHIIVAHAGLSGCILGIFLCSLLHWAIKDQYDMKMLASLVVVVATTVGCLEVALEGTSASARDTSTFTLFDALMSLRWLVNFLFAEPSDDKFVQRMMPPRVVILFYWIAILAVSFPISIHIASWTTQKIKHQLLQRPARKRRVVIARKFFHFVAILLFAPITWLDRDMMCLSYAIALSLMLVIEMLRCADIGEESSRTFAVSNTTNISEASSTEVSSLNTFYTMFFDEKDTSGGVVVSHISLIAGCACPLWVYQLLQHYHQLGSTSTDWQLLSLLPSIGVIVLGIGDSAAALGGLSFKHPTPWPGGSSRTIEGSLCMFISMVCAVVFFILFADLDLWQSALRIAFPLFVFTLVEASTKQIDNACLPIVASTLFILVTVI